MPAYLKNLAKYCASAAWFLIIVGTAELVRLGHKRFYLVKVMLPRSR